ncbi:hypothetical protein ACFY3N_00795 [Streptomyces sp. NPDC000348]|uniref:hypothetical protein n=1 Tax=Streptomyces sp. NPDC000348 TaxID=3364538 RepID=UPI0036CA784F
MPQPVLSLGCAAVTAAGCVWYLPALADLRAGADRPLSRRTAAIACLTGWGTLGAVALVLLVATEWWIPVAVGGPAAAALRVRAAVRRAGEQREAARQWAQLPHVPPSADAHHSRGAVAAVTLAGPVVGAAAVAALASAPVPGAAVVVPAAIVMVPAVAVGLVLAIAVRHTRPGRGRHPG